MHKCYIIKSLVYNKSPHINALNIMEMCIRILLIVQFDSFLKWGENWEVEQKNETDTNLKSS